MPDRFSTFRKEYKRDDYTVDIGKTRSEKHYPYGAYGAYFPHSGRIAIRLGNKRQAQEDVKKVNRNQEDTRMHKSGLKLKHRRSYQDVERKLPGAGKYEDESDAAARTISHESLHKVIHKAAGADASQKLDDIYAARGYHGIVQTQRRFIVGEAGPERVNITPLRRLSNNRSNNFGQVRFGISRPRKTPSIFSKGSLNKLARF